MAVIGEMLQLTINGKTYTLPSGGGGSVSSVAVSNATNGGLSVSGSPITSSGTITIGHSNVLSSAQTTQAVYPIKIDKNGHISAYGSAITIPTKVSDLTNDSGFVTTDEKLKIASVTSGTTYYPIVGSGTTAATRQYDGTGFSYDATTSTTGYARITLGNSTAQSTSGSKYGQLRLYGTTANATTIVSGSPTSSRTITLPDKTGTVALTSDIPTVSYPVTSVNSKTGEVSLTASDVGALASSTTYVSTITTTAGTHSAISSKSGTVSFNVPTKTSHLTNDSGFITASHTSTYSLPLAASGTRGGVQIGYSESGTNYAVKLSSEKMYVSVPWTDTKVTTAALTSGTTYYPILATGTGTATRQIDSTLTGLRYVSTAGTTSTVGTAILSLGNTTASGSANNEQGVLRLYSSGATYYTDIKSSSTSSHKTITLPNATGTVALASDIPTVPTNISAFTNDSGYLTGITSSQVTTALGYTPYNSTNPNGYTSNTGTVTKVTAGTGLSIGTTAGGNFTTSGTINHTNSVTAQTTQAVYPIKIDAQGHISGYGSAVTSMPASDVSSWAKASSKPSYTASEVGAAASTHAHGNITSGGDITATAPTIANGDQIIINDNSASKITNGPTFDGSTTTKALTPKGTWETFLKSYTETDPTVPSWAKASSKPSYTASEVGAVPTSRTVNGKALSSNITLSASDVSALYEGTLSMSGLTAYSSRCVVSAGGYFKIGTMVFIQLRATNSGSLASNNTWGYIDGFPIPTANSAAISAYASQNYGNISAIINNVGRLVIATGGSALAANTDMYFAGWYMASS